MENQRDFIPKRKLLWLLGFFAIMMAVGSIFDYPISLALYNEQNVFGILGAAYGEYPATLGFLTAGTLLWIGHSRENKLKAVLQCMGGTMLMLSGALMATVMPTHYITGASAVVMAFGVLVSVAVVVCLIKLCKNTDRKTVIRVATVIFFVIFSEMIIVNIIKIPWGRPRMRLVANNPLACFIPWWQPGSGLKETLLATGIAAEEFKSFPSGHVANAATMMLLGLLPTLNSKLANKKNLFIAMGFVWACLVALSRIIMGAHFLTDTTVGFGVSVAIILVIYKMVFSKAKDDRLN